MAPRNGAHAKETIMKARNHHWYAPRHLRGITGLTLVAVIAIVAAIAEPRFLVSERLDAVPAASVAAGGTTQSTATATGDDYFPDRYPAPTKIAEPAPTF
jgi:hypothetical protein